MFCIRSLNFPQSSDFLERQGHSKFIWLDIVGIILALLRTNMDIVSKFVFFFSGQIKKEFFVPAIFVRF